MAAMLAAASRPKPSAKASEKLAGGREVRPAPPPPPPPDRNALDAAERALAEARERLAHELDANAEERAELDAGAAHAGDR